VLIKFCAVYARYEVPVPLSTRETFSTKQMSVVYLLWGRHLCT